MSNIIPLICGIIVYIELSMCKQVPSTYVIIPTHEGYILPLGLLLGLPCKSMRTYPPEACKIISHAVLIPNMDRNTSALHFTEPEYDEYGE